MCDAVAVDVPVVIGGGAQQSPTRDGKLSGRSPVLLTIAGAAGTPSVPPATPKATESDKAEADALYRQGDDTYYGRAGVKQDDTKAAELYRKAADLGHTGAMNNLGLMYEVGRGVGKDEKKAVELYRKAADLGYSPATYNLGLMYENGRGVAKDEEKAADLYRKAADLGHTGAMNNLGLMYEAGRGVEKDEKKAVELYRKAAAKGSEYAKDILKLLGKE